jgi:hypothetical protein
MLIENPLNSSEFTFPVLECVHIVGFAFSVGTAAIVDFRLLDIGMTNQSPAQLWNNTWRWTLGGLFAVIFSGLLLFSTDPDSYYLNYAFLAKMVFLILALVYNYTVVRKTVTAVIPPRNSRRVGTISLALWACVAFGGIFIGVLSSTLDTNQV